MLVFSLWRRKASITKKLFKLCIVKNGFKKRINVKFGINAIIIIIIVIAMHGYLYYIQLINKGHCVEINTKCFSERFGVTSYSSIIIIILTFI